MGGAIKSAARVNNSKASAPLKCCRSILSKFKHQRLRNPTKRLFLCILRDGRGLVWFPWMGNHKVLNAISFELHFCIIVKNGTLKQGSDTKHLTILLLNTFTALLLVLTGQIKVPCRDRAYQCLALWVLSPRNPAEKPRWKSFSSEFEIFEGSRRWKRERGRSC